MGQCKSSPIPAQPCCKEVHNVNRQRDHCNVLVEKPMCVMLLTITPCSSISSASTIESFDQEDSKSTASTASISESFSVIHYDDNESDMCATTRRARRRNVIQVHFDKTEVELVERFNL